MIYWVVNHHILKFFITNVFQTSTMIYQSSTCIKNCQTMTNFYLHFNVLSLKGLIKYNKMNDIAPMKTHIDVTHAHLLVKRKLKLTIIVATNHFDINHSQQLRKRKVAPFGSTITTFFGSTHLYKHGDEAQQQFLEDLVFYICKGYKPLSTCKNI